MPGAMTKFWIYLGLAAVLIACTGGESASTSEPGQETGAVSGPLVAMTEYGPVRGFVDEGVLTFKGVRYGANTQNTRFRAPNSPEPWNEVADANEYGPACPQATGPRLSLFDSWAPEPDPGQSEDCLFLNVWTPGLDESARPVLVWFHGGGFTSGSGSSSVYDGVRLVNRGDVVVVTVNHRLNVFGYLHLADYGEAYAESGTAGMVDLVASLEWVRDNISAFGGDPNNVLIFGESGGGWKVSTIMAMDSAQGLFHRAVAQSGPGLEVATQASASAASGALIEALGLTAETVSEIDSLPIETILAAAQQVYATGKRPGARPVVDGVNISRQPFSPDAPAQSVDVPLLIGSTKHEMTMLAGAARPEWFELSWETLPAALAEAIPGADGQVIMNGYRKLHPELDASTLFFEAITDQSIFGRGSFTMADRKAEQGGASVYQYYLTWETPVEGGKWGATHALDLAFMFDNVASSESMSGTGEAQQALADVMSEAWLAFAREGDPNHEGLPDWPEYQTTDRATMIFDNEPRVVNDPRGQERAIIDTALGGD